MGIRIKQIRGVIVGTDNDQFSIKKIDLKNFQSNGFITWDHSCKPEHIIAEPSNVQLKDNVLVSDLNFYDNKLFTNIDFIKHLSPVIGVRILKINKKTKKITKCRLEQISLFPHINPNKSICQLKEYLK